MNRNEALRVLGVSSRFTQEELKLTYKKLARKYHPDIAGAEYTKKFAQINEAYAELSKVGEVMSCKLTHKNIFDMERA